VSILRKLKLSAFGESAKGGLYTFPVNIIKHSSLPIGWEEGVMPFRFLDQPFAESGSSACGGDVVILFLGYQSAIIKEGCQGAWNPIRELSYFAWVSVMGFGADVVCYAVGFCLKGKFAS
jgi:hypothetical protein